MTNIKNSSNKPSNYQDGFYIYTSSSLLEKCNLDDEYEKIFHDNPNTRITREGLEVHMSMMINYLTYYLNHHSLTSLSSKFIRRASNSYYYKLCLNILKRNKILFIRGIGGKESYLTGSYCKDYKFNYNITRLEYDTAKQVRVNDARLINKIQKNDQLAIPSQFEDRYEKRKVSFTRLIGQKLIKKAKSLISIAHNARIIKKHMKMGSMFIESRILKERLEYVKRKLAGKFLKISGYRLSDRYYKLIPHPKVINKMITRWEILSQTHKKWEVFNDFELRLTDKLGFPCLTKHKFMQT